MKIKSKREILKKIGAIKAYLDGYGIVEIAELQNVRKKKCYIKKSQFISMEFPNDKIVPELFDKSIQGYFISDIKYDNSKWWDNYVRIIFILEKSDNFETNIDGTVLEKIIEIIGENRG